MFFNKSVVAVEWAGKSRKWDAVCRAPGGSRRQDGPSAHLGLPDGGIWGFAVYPWDAAFFTPLEELPPLCPPPQLQPSPSPARAPKERCFPRASISGRVTQFPVPWEGLASGNCCVRSHCLFVICSRLVSNVSLVPRQSPDPRVWWRQQPQKLYFGFKSSSRIMLTHEFSVRALGSSEAW